MAKPAIDEMRLPLRPPPLASLPLVISVEEDGNDDVETEGDNKSRFDNADVDPEGEPAPPEAMAAAIGVEGAMTPPSDEIRSSEPEKCKNIMKLT